MFGACVIVATVPLKAMVELNIPILVGLQSCFFMLPSLFLYIFLSFDP